MTNRATEAARCNTVLDMNLLFGLVRVFTLLLTPYTFIWPSHSIYMANIYGPITPKIRIYGQITPKITPYTYTNRATEAELSNKELDMQLLFGLVGVFTLLLTPYTYIWPHHSIYV